VHLPEVEVIRLQASQRLLDSLVTQAPPKNRETEAEKTRARAAKRYVAA